MTRCRASTGLTCSLPSCCVPRAKFCCDAGPLRRRSIRIVRHFTSLRSKKRCSGNCAALSLARVRVSQGRSHEERQLVAPVYDSFTEGFETPDLQAARAMLDRFPT